MKRQFTITAITVVALLALFGTVVATPKMTADGGATQISGIGYFDTAGECTDSQGFDFDYPLKMTGDLTGCHYIDIVVSRCSRGGAYYEVGAEKFIGMYNGGSGTFKTNYVFTAVYRNCPAFIGEIAGRCQHPIAAGTGTGIFDGVRGRIDMKDDVVEGNFPYRGHVSFDDSLAGGTSRSLKDSPDLIGMLSTGGGC